MRYLIDGYNLLYALGLVRKSGGRGAWDRARRQLLDWLADRHTSSSADVTVIFDAQNSLGGVIVESHRGLRIIRDRGRTADDLIEEMLKVEHTPESLTVVSNDRRVRDAGIVRGCQTLTCEAYIDLVLSPQEVQASSETAEEKPSTSSPEEQAEWLKAFNT